MGGSEGDVRIHIVKTGPCGATRCGRRGLPLRWRRWSGCGRGGVGGCCVLAGAQLHIQNAGHQLRATAAVLLLERLDIQFVQGEAVQTTFGEVLRQRSCKLTDRQSRQKMPMMDAVSTPCLARCCP